MAVRRMAKTQGFLDPFNLIEQLQRFAQPSEVAIPVEIVRLGSALHARGLMNSQAIQHNLDWVWPFWVERQFDPYDVAFIPRAFSISHINLTHRNWTAVGLPDCPAFPLVDPAGLVTPLFDSWSIDSWIVADAGGNALIPSRLPAISQKLLLNDGLAVLTESFSDLFRMSSLVDVIDDPVFPICRIRIKAESNTAAWCAVSLRPYNPEGISCIHDIHLLEKHYGWRVNGESFVYLDQEPDRCAFSDYRNGDVHHFLPNARHCDKVICDVGMATAAAAYRLEPGKPREITVRIPLSGRDKQHYKSYQHLSAKKNWEKHTEGACELKVPDEKFQFLYDAALKTMILHAPREVYPGPYTYKHFWFRDAAFILNAMLCAGLAGRVEKVIDASFFSRQNSAGYFHSQDGEWDSNGQALWSLMQFCRLTGRAPKQEWKNAVEKGAEWIQKKRLPESSDKPHAGLFPPGFSAEHLGPNDYYYWDDFWGAAGFYAASYLMRQFGEEKKAARLQESGNDFLRSIEESLSAAAARLGHSAMPASPYRRMDSGAIGSLAGGYPLQLWEPHHPGLKATVDYLIKECSFDGGFFHDMSHSGINPYLTLHLAQILLRAGDTRYYTVMKTIADLASPTGQWPEAIHPQTKGGCMGDGQHVWAAAEWVLMMRHCFVREEKDKLILFSGIPAEWLNRDEEIRFGPAPTAFGTISLLLKPEGEKIKIKWKGQWFSKPPVLEIRLAGQDTIVAPENQNEIEVLQTVRK